jgi:2-methylcitrate dehydratase PrpD
MTDPGITGRLGGFIVTSGQADWPEDVLELGRRHILDTIASIVVCGDRESAHLSRDFATRMSGGAAGGAPILGTKLSASLPDAVFASRAPPC